MTTSSRFRAKCLMARLSPLMNLKNISLAGHHLKRDVVTTVHHFKMQFELVIGMFNLSEKLILEVIF